MMKHVTQCMRYFIPLLFCINTVYANESGTAAIRGRSAGCGIKHAETNGNFIPERIRLLNRERTYYLRVPAKYDPEHPYPLIFRWHGAGGNGISGGLEIERNAGNDALVVGADGLDKSWRNNSDFDDLLLDSDYTYLMFNTDPADLLLFDRMLDTLAKQYCIDLDRIYSYGFSAGGYFTNLLACERGDVLRASAAIASGPRGGNCSGKVARWFLHDTNDRIVPITDGKAARDRAIELNGCSTFTTDEGDGCVKYLGCTTSPVIWCESRGFDHAERGDFAPAKAWRFFQGLP